MLIGKVLKQRYKITEAIGSGAFGNTYVAIDLDFPEEPRRVVKHLCPTHSDPESWKHAKRLFKTEAKCLAKLGEYDRIPRLFADFEVDHEFYLVQELIEGQDLTHEFQPGQRWSESETVDFLSELLSILSIVHRNDIIRRDVKPANIMRRRDDRKLVLIDFGAVKEKLTVDRNGETNTIGIGAIAYMPPEQAMGNPKKSSDIYAVGMIGVQALTGLAARDFPSDSEGLQDIWQNSNIEVSDKLKSILEKMVSFQYKLRFADADAALEALASSENSDALLNESAIDREPHNRSTDPTATPEIFTPTEASNTSQSQADSTIIIKSFPKKLLWGTIAAVALISGAGIYLTQTFNKPDYTQLETYLENKQWKQADLETNKIILEIAREPSELDTESIAKFPCKSLAKIDELWTKNSDGRFGFTPQKQAYLETGNEFDGVSAESMYKAFGDRIGWRTKIFGGDDWNMGSVAKT